VLFCEIMKGPLLVIALALLIGVVAGAGYLYVTSQKAPAGPNLIENTNSSTSSSTNSVVTEKEKQGTLLMSYGKTLLPSIETTLPVAQGLCGLVYGNFCAWNGSAIKEKTFYLYGSKDKQPSITVSQPYPKTVVQYGPSVPIRFTDAGPTGPHRVYLIHRNLLGEVNEVHEAHIVSESGTSELTLVWDGNESLLNERGSLVVQKLPKGHYELVVVNTATGVEGGVSSWIHTIDSASDVDKVTGSYIKPYALNTPLVNSYWDGRGIFFDGGGDEDNIGLTFKRSEIAVFRGIDVPEKGQLNTLVFFRRPDNVVIVTANVETFQFADQKLTVAQLLQQIASGK